MISGFTALIDQPVHRVQLNHCRFQWWFFIMKPFACLFLLVAAHTCLGRSVYNPDFIKQVSGTKEKPCQESAKKLQPRSCADYLKNGADKCGYYKIFDAAGNGFTVYCDMETEPGAAWTLIMSWSLKNNMLLSFSKPLSTNYPVNENSPNWFLYRLTKDRMRSISDVSTHWRATCGYDKYGINNYKDYVRGKTADVSIFSYFSGTCIQTELINVRGHTGIHQTARFYHSSNHLPHIQSDTSGCQFYVSGLSSEDNFGFYQTKNPMFTCSRNAASTTQWWFGGYQ